MELPYQVFIHARVLSFAQTRGGARVIAELAESLAKHPFQAGDFQDMDEFGRKVEVTIIGKYAITYWADHAMREVRINKARSAD